MGGHFYKSPPIAQFLDVIILDLRAPAEWTIENVEGRYFGAFHTIQSRNAKSIPSLELRKNHSKSHPFLLMLLSKSSRSIFSILHSRHHKVAK